jgi:hypothetical protein
MCITGAGNVAIGTDNPTPTYKLEVSATSGSERIRVGTLQNNLNSSTFEAITSSSISTASSGWLRANTGGTTTIGTSSYTKAGGDSGNFSNLSAEVQTPAITITGANVNIAGALSKGSGAFRIDHPLESMTTTHQLVHSFIEGPKADLIYRGKLNLVNGLAQVNIDSSSTMTDGTFEVLCRDIQCFTTNESGWTAVRGKVTGNILTIEAQDVSCSDTISWMVIGERKDKHMMDTDWTDDNGRVIVEPLKQIQSS